MKDHHDDFAVFAFKVIGTCIIAIFTVAWVVAILTPAVQPDPNW